MDMRIRIYSKNDFGACRSLWVELTQHHRDIYGDPTIGGDDPGAGLEEYLANPARRDTWVAELDGDVVGMTGLIVHGDEADIEPVVVAAKHRSQGIGTSLVQYAVKEAEEAGVRFLSVQPVARNADALSFFVRCGFGIVGHIDLFQDLKPSLGREWKPGFVVHGKMLRH